MSLLRIVKHEQIIHMMYAFVVGVKLASPETTTEKAVDMFYSQFDLTEESFVKKDSARVRFHQLVKDVYGK